MNDRNLVKKMIYNHYKIVLFLFSGLGCSTSVTCFLDINISCCYNIYYSFYVVDLMISLASCSASCINYYLEGSYLRSTSSVRRRLSISSVRRSLSATRRRLSISSVLRSTSLVLRLISSVLRRSLSVIRRLSISLARTSPKSHSSFFGFYGGELGFLTNFLSSFLCFFIYDIIKYIIIINNIIPNIMAAAFYMTVSNILIIQKRYDIVHKRI